MPFNFEKTKLDGVIVVAPRIFEDDRGFFCETYKSSEFKANGINVDFVQDNYSFSHKGVIRGLHYQTEPAAQAKLVRAITGRIFDVAVDIRPTSETFGLWFGTELSHDNRKMLFIPEGFAHGFSVLSDTAEVMYKVNSEYSPQNEAGIVYNDPQIDIDWGVDNAVLSEKDKVLPRLADL